MISFKQTYGPKKWTTYPQMRPPSTSLGPGWAK